MDLDLDDPRLFLSDEIVDDPRPLYDMLRREVPVWRLPGDDTYVVADPELIREAVGRPDEFSSNLVSLLYRDDTNRPASFGLAPLGDPVHVLATADPPLHSRHRKLLQPHLSPAAVAGLEPTVRKIVNGHLDSLLAAGHGDFVAMFGNPVPTQVICAVIGLPPDDAPRLIELVADTGVMLDGAIHADGIERGATAALETSLYAQERLDAARHGPEADTSGLLAVMVDAIKAGTVSPDEARDMLVVLINAGTETTSSLLATAVETLARTPDLQAELRAHPDGIRGRDRRLPSRRRPIPVPLPMDNDRHDPRWHAHPGPEPRPPALGRGEPPGTEPPDRVRRGDAVLRPRISRSVAGCTSASERRSRASKPASPSSNSSRVHPRSHSTRTVRLRSGPACSSADTRASRSTSPRETMHLRRVTLRKGNRATNAAASQPPGAVSAVSRSVASPTTGWTSTRPSGVRSARRCGVTLWRALQRRDRSAAPICSRTRSACSSRSPMTAGSARPSATSVTLTWPARSGWITG